MNESVDGFADSDFELYGNSPMHMPSTASQEKEGRDDALTGLDRSKYEIVVDARGVKQIRLVSNRPVSVAHSPNTNPAGHAKASAGGPAADGDDALDWGDGGEDPADVHVAAARTGSTVPLLGTSATTAHSTARFFDDQDDEDDFDDSDNGWGQLKSRSGTATGATGTTMAMGDAPRPPLAAVKGPVLPISTRLDLSRLSKSAAGSPSTDVPDSSASSRSKPLDGEESDPAVEQFHFGDTPREEHESSVIARMKEDEARRTQHSKQQQQQRRASGAAVGQLQDSLEGAEEMEEMEDSDEHGFLKGHGVITEPLSAGSGTASTTLTASHIDSSDRSTRLNSTSSLAMGADKRRSLDVSAMRNFGLLQAVAEEPGAGDDSDDFELGAGTKLQARAGDLPVGRVFSSSSSSSSLLLSPTLSAAAAAARPSASPGMYILWQAGQSGRYKNWELPSSTAENESEGCLSFSQSRRDLALRSLSSSNSSFSASLQSQSQPQAAAVDAKSPGVAASMNAMLPARLGVSFSGAAVSGSTTAGTASASPPTAGGGSASSTTPRGRHNREFAKTLSHFDQNSKMTLLSAMDPAHADSDFSLSEAEVKALTKLGKQSVADGHVFGLVPVPGETGSGKAGGTNFYDAGKQLLHLRDDLLLAMTHATSVHSARMNTPFGGR